MTTTAEYGRTALSRTPRMVSRPAGVSVAVVWASVAVLVSPHAITFGLWIAVMIGAAVAFSSFDDSYLVESSDSGRVIRHRTWIRTVAVRTDEIVSVEQGDADAPSRDVLLTDRHGRAINIRQSALRADAELASLVAGMSAAAQRQSLATLE